MRETTTRRRLLAALAAGTTLGIAGCGGGGDATATETLRPEPTATPTAEPTTRTPKPTATADPTGTKTPAQRGEATETTPEPTPASTAAPTCWSTTQDDEFVTPPDGGFGWDFDGETRTATLTRMGGERFDGSNTQRLVFSIGSWEDRSRVCGAEWPLPVESGDSRTFAYGEPGVTVWLVWMGPDDHAIGVVRGEAPPEPRWKRHA